MATNGDNGAGSNGESQETFWFWSVFLFKLYYNDHLKICTFLQGLSQEISQQESMMHLNNNMKKPTMTWVHLEGDVNMPSV